MTLSEVQAQNGAVWGEVDGKKLPRHFGDVAREWAAVRQRCGLIDAGFRALWRLTGGDRVTFLQGMVTNDVAKVPEGLGTYAALLTIQGRVIADARVYVLADELWLDCAAGCAASVHDSLERYIIADDVELLEAGDWSPLVVVEGPQAARVLLAVVGESLTDLPAMAHREVDFDGGRVRIAAVTHSGAPGYIVFGATALAARFWSHCQAAGAEPVGMDALNVLRVEAGIPWVGHDMDESTLIGEVGLEAAISFRKGCYLGQEVVERVAARGQVQRKRVGLLCAGETIPNPGARISRDGKEVGHVTSAVWSPHRNQVIAMAYVRREAWDEGTELLVDSAAGPIAASVGILPFLID
jgi:aminomethyltransferase